MLVLPKLHTITDLTLNEVGDFCAGLFGPLAFLWLVLGYFQQGAELRQNNEALRLQAIELKNSVEQQRNLVEVTSKQVEYALEHSRFERANIEATMAPNLEVEYVASEEFNGLVEVILEVTNQGMPAGSIVADLHGDGPVRTIFERDLLNKGVSSRFTVDVESSGIADLSKAIVIRCSNLFGSEICYVYGLSIYKDSQSKVYVRVNRNS